MSAQCEVFVAMERGDAAELCLSFDPDEPVKARLEHNGVTLTGPRDEILVILDGLCYANNEQREYLINAIKEI